MHMSNQIRVPIIRPLSVLVDQTPRHLTLKHVVSFVAIFVKSSDMETIQVDGDGLFGVELQTVVIRKLSSRMF